MSKVLFLVSPTLNSFVDRRKGTTGNKIDCAFQHFKNSTISNVQIGAVAGATALVGKTVFDSAVKKAPELAKQLEGKGGFMLDASIGKSIYLKHGQLSVNLMLTNILNNTKITTGGFEQSRSDVSYKDDGSVNKERTYKFSRNPKLYYAYGINGMLNITYRF